MRLEAQIVLFMFFFFRHLVQAASHQTLSGPDPLESDQFYKTSEESDIEKVQKFVESF